MSDFEYIRKLTEEIEQKNLCSWATLSSKTLGREVFEEPCDIRTEFQRDRDRIIHSKSFRRLKHKTQVFIAPIGDHYRTRLTHTLEVSQIARTVARALRLNEDLTEAISLGHDLGHSPFGHAGESALNNLCPTGFKHYKQSVRILEHIERDGVGLNLTKEVINGILCHTSGEQAFTPEGRLVRICDKIAYINHDIEDSMRAGILEPNSIPNYLIKNLGDTCSARIDTLVKSLIQNSKDNNIIMSAEATKNFEEIHEFMYKNVYLNKRSFSEEHKVPFVINSLYNYFKNNFDKIPSYLQKLSHKDGPDRVICDYISGMTDDFAINLFKKIFLPGASKVY